MTECKLSKSGNLVAAMAPLGGPSIQALGFRILVLVCVCVCVVWIFCGGGGGGRFVIFCNPETPLSLQKQLRSSSPQKALAMHVCSGSVGQTLCRSPGVGFMSAVIAFHVGTGVAGIMLDMSKLWPFLPRLQVQKSS